MVMPNERLDTSQKTVLWVLKILSAGDPAAVFILLNTNQAIKKINSHKKILPAIFSNLFSKPGFNCKNRESMC